MATAQISEFEQSLDDMLYAAYADGRADERDEIQKMVTERLDRAPFADRGAYIDMLLLVLRRTPSAQDAA